MSEITTIQLVGLAGMKPRGRREHGNNVIATGTDTVRTASAINWELGTVLHRMKRPGRSWGTNLDVS